MPLSVLASAQRADVDRGLKAAADAPVRSGYVEALGTWNAFDGGVGRVEAGVHPWANVTAYAAGTLDRNGPGAEIGARWDFNWG